ncbi:MULTISPECIES: isochorismatase family protein [Arthrobacter]|uniref:isochorismatase family protein n=1 Tax=Arthrobacter TaxID=1663 RepID=UPI000AFB4007|nr:MULTISPECIES: isochorismatase family protein [Arthrobacter]
MDTTLAGVLALACVGYVVVAGAQTDACIRSTIHGAFTRGYDVTLVSDAHSTSDLSGMGAPVPDQVIVHTNLYCPLLPVSAGPGPRAVPPASWAQMR